MCGEWNLAFRRSFGQEEVGLWNALRLELEPCVFSEARDSVSWALEPSGLFSTASLYRKICSGLPMPGAKLLWKASMPLKIKIFMWQLQRDRLPSREQLLKRQGPSNGLCELCHRPESADHIFFSCVFAKLAWAGWRDMFLVQWNPASLAECLALFLQLPGKQHRPFWILLAAQCWAIWQIRNKYSIERVFPNNPANVFFKTLILLQQWQPLFKDKDKELLEEFAAKLKHTYTVASQHRSAATPPVAAPP